MSKTLTTLALACVLLALAVTAQAQTFAPTGTGAVRVAVAPEASISIDAATATLTTPSTTFANYSGTTAFTYKIRTGSATSGTITLKVTADFSPANGPSVANSGTTGDTLSYTCTSASSMTPNSTATNASTAASTGVGTFGANAHSAKAGDTGSVAWTLVNDPAYAVDTFTATVTYTISAT